MGIVRAALGLSVVKCVYEFWLSLEGRYINFNAIMAPINMSLKKLYLETTIPSYMLAKPSRDILVLGRQEITRKW